MDNRSEQARTAPSGSIWATARHLSRDRRPYKTADGYLSVIVYNDKQWENFFEATGREVRLHRSRADREVLGDLPSVEASLRLVAQFGKKRAIWTPLSEPSKDCLPD